MKYPVATLLAGFQENRENAFLRSQKQLAEETDLMIRMRKESKDEIHTFAQGLKAAYDLYVSGGLRDEDTESVVNNRLVEILEEHTPSSYRGWGANNIGNSKSTMREQQKKVARCRDACNSDKQKSAQELFLEELLAQSITEVSDYTFQKAGFQTKLGHVFATGKKRLDAEKK